VEGEQQQLLTKNNTEQMNERKTNVFFLFTVALKGV
jgi:hypothetical protein